METAKLELCKELKELLGQVELGLKNQSLTQEALDSIQSRIVKICDALDAFEKSAS